MSEFNPCFAIYRDRYSSRRYLKNMQDLLDHVPGVDLDHVLSKAFNELVFEGTASLESREFQKLLCLLQSNRRWRTIELGDRGQRRATPEFLTLVVWAVAKTNEVVLRGCPLDQNFFACLNSGMQTLTHVTLRDGNAPISFDAAAMFATGLAMSGSLQRLEIREKCRFEPGAGLGLVGGIKRNKSLKNLMISESNLGTVAMMSFFGAVDEGCLPTLVTLNIKLKYESGCTEFLTKLMCSDTCQVENLTIDAYDEYSTIFWTDGVRMGKGNLKLKSLRISCAQLDESFFKVVLPMMPMLSHLGLTFCGISDITPIVDYLCRPYTAIKSMNLINNRIGIDQAEYFAGSLAGMQSLTDVNMGENNWCYDHSVDEERAKSMLKKVSNCRNLEKFEFRFFSKKEWARGLDPSLSMAINRAWRRELCYKNSSPSSKLLPLVIARALRKTEHVLRADVILPLLQERLSDLMPVPNEEKIQPCEKSLVNV